MSSLNVSQFRPVLPPVESMPMTVNGTVVRSGMLLMLTALAGAAGWVFLPASLMLPALLLSIGGSIVFSVMASRNPLNAKLPALGYAVLQGAVVGAVARGFEQSYGGIVVPALLATAVTVAVSLVLFATRIVRVSRKARSIIAIASLSAFVFYVGAFVLGLLGFDTSGVWGGDAGLLGIGFSLVMLAIATATLFSNYAVIDEAIASGADERFEWFAAFGIVSSVLWVFLEMMRLLSRFR